VRGDGEWRIDGCPAYLLAQTWEQCGRRRRCGRRSARHTEGTQARRSLIGVVHDIERSGTNTDCSAAGRGRATSRKTANVSVSKLGSLSTKSLAKRKRGAMSAKTKSHRACTECAAYTAVGVHVYTEIR
jgi:hypothetical protein